MQKKVLIPLLMAGTATLPALADISVGFPKSNAWAQSGTTGYQNGWSLAQGIETLEFDNAIGTGEISTTVDLPKGRFKLTFEQSDNISVFIGGSEVLPTADNVYEFDVQAAGQVVIAIRPTRENNPCSFTGQDLILIVDGNAIADELVQLRSDINTIGFEDVNSSDTYDDAVVLREQKDQMVTATNVYESESGKTYDDVIEAIRSLDDAGHQLDTETLKIYNDYRLYDEVNDPEAKLTQLKKDQEAYNTAVESENAAWDNHEANVAKYNELKAGQESLVSNDMTSVVDCAQIKAEIDAWQVVDATVKQPLYEALAAIEAKVAAYGEELDAVFFAPDFTDDALRVAIEFESKEDALRDELTKLQNTLQQDVSDYDAYYKVNFVLMKELEDVYNLEYRPILTLLQPIEGYEKTPEVYGDIFTAETNFTDPSILCEKEAEKLVNSTKEQFQIKNVEGAAEYDMTEGCTAGINAAIDQLRASIDNFINLVKTQDANKEEAQAQIKKLREDLEMFKGYEVLNNDKAEYATKLAEFEQGINDLETLVNEQYKVHNLNFAEGSDYALQLSNIETLSNELLNLAGDPELYVTKLQKMLDNARANVVKEGIKTVTVKEQYINESGVLDLRNKPVTINVASKFEGTFDALQEAINAIETQDEAEAAMQQDNPNSIAYQIQEAVNNAQNMAGMFGDALLYISALENGDENYYKPIALFQVKTSVNAKGIVNKEIVYGDPKKKKLTNVAAVEAAKAVYNFVPYEEVIAAYKEKWDTAYAAENQEAWQLINALYGELSTEVYNPNGLFGLYGDMLTTWSDFLVTCTEANKAYAHQLYTDLQNKKTDAESSNVTNIEEIDFSNVEKALNDADTKCASLNPRDILTLEGNAKTVDDLYEAALAAIYVQEDNLADIVANQEAFNALTAQLQDAKDALAGLRGYNETNSLDPAKTFYEGKIDEIAEEIDKKSVELAAEVEKETADDHFTKLEGEIGEIEVRINELSTDVTNNNSYHNAQLNLEKTVRTTIEGYIVVLNAYDEDQQNLPLVVDTKNKLEKLLNEDLVNANLDVTKAYGEGNSVSENDRLIAEYYRIKDEAESEYKACDTGLAGAVAEENSKTTADWENWMTELDNIKEDAVRTYNYFAFFLKNPGWSAYVSDDIVDFHDSVFKYYGEDGLIETLKDEKDQAVNEWNADKHVITDDEWAIWAKKYEDLKAEIINDYDAMLDAMNGLSNTFYTREKGEADTAVAAAETALTDAGIDTTEYLKEAKEYVAEAESEYWRGSKVDVQKDNDEDVSLEMDHVADVLDKVSDNINVQAYALDAWTKVYAAAQANIDTMREELEGYDFAAPEVVKAQTEIFNTNVNKAAGVNTKAVNDKELVKNYKADCEELQGYLDNMAEAVATVKQSNDANVENMNIYGDFINWSKEAQTGLDELRAYCESMAGCFNKMGLVDALQSELDAFKKDVEKKKATLVNEDVPGRMADFDAKVLATYFDEAAAEKTYLSGKVDEATDAFAEAYRNRNLTDAEFAELTADIQDIDAAVEALVFDANDKEAFRDEAVKYEKELSDIYTKLKASYTANPTTAVLNSLEGRYATINAEIEKGKTFLAGCMDEVKAKYPEAYKAYEDALNAERAAWQGEGTYVMDREPFHNTALDKIAREVGDLTDKIKADEQKARAEAEKIRVSEERYDVLKGEYDGLVEDFETAKATVEGYGNDISENLTYQANRIQGMLDQSLKDLDSARAAHSLTANSQLSNAKAIEAEIDSYALQGARQKATIDLNAAKEAGRDASSALAAQTMVPADLKKLTEEYQTANTKLNALLNEQQHAGVTRLEEISAEAAALVETFNSIAERAQESYFVLGNVNMDEEGEVNAVDVQALINLVGEGETYEDLYAADPRQACAADVAGNKVIDIADVTALIQMIIGDQPQVVKVMAHMPAVTGNDHLTIAFIGEEEGVRRYALSLTNTTEFIGAQIDIKASGNARIVGMSTAERTANHDVYMFENIDGARAVMVSMENAVFAGTDGVVMYVDVEGKGELTVSDAVFSDKDNVAHRLDKAHTSHIDALIDGVKDGAARIYDAAGRAYNRLQKGINIIRHKDGTVTKEMHK